MAKKMLTDGSNSGVAPAKELDDFASEPGRFALYLRSGSFAEVAREAKVSATAIKHQADRYRWRERKLEHDRKAGLTRAAAASTKTLGHLEAIDAAVAAETRSWDEADEDVDVMHRAAATVQVVERLAKVQREAMADLPAEKEPALDLSPMSNAMFSVWLAHGQLTEALKATTAASPFRAPAKHQCAVIVALLESEVGRAFIREYEREHGIQTKGLV